MIRVLVTAGIVLLLSGPSAAATVSYPARGAQAEAITLYRTRAGDTLTGLAARSMGGPRDVDVVQRLNGIVDANRLPAGALLRIPTRLLKSTPLALTVLAVTGPVTRTGASGPSAALAKGDLLREGDRVSTGPNAFATLSQADGSRLTLPSHTTLRIAALRRVELDDSTDSDFIIEGGKGDVSVTPLRRPTDRFEVRTPAAVAAVRGTEFRVGYEPERSISTLEVTHGRVGESTSEDGPSADIVTGFAAQRPLGGERQIIPLPPAPVLLPPDKIQLPPRLILRVAAPHLGWSYHVVLARDPGFVDVVAELVAPTGVALFATTPPGPLLARITAIEEHGVEGFAKVYAIQREDTSSPNGATR